ncbi:MAG TPA: glycosyltransferase family 2 protein, partial [Terriglobales bacterium]|nr:glycosyltransferase family 2 protein [Terriglobales bacterium]
MSQSLSVVIITLNEEANIGRTLASVADLVRQTNGEIIVVDSGSTDRTVEIAREAGALVSQHEFTNYVMQKQMALDRATGDWVLLMDADEQATHDLGEEIVRAVNSASASQGYRIRRVLYHLGHYYPFGLFPDRPVRLFRRELGHIGGIDPHDRVEVAGAIGKLRAPILHFSYRDISDH